MTSRKQRPQMLPPRILLDHPGNVRDNLEDIDELAASIRAQGLIAPIVVTPHRRAGHFLILAGHRRAAACRTIPLDTVPCLIREDGGDELDQVALMLNENMQRSNLSAVEKARGMQRLVDGGLNQVAVARKLGVTPATVNTHLMLLELSDDELDAIEAGEIQVGHAKAVARQARAAKRVTDGTPVRGRPVVAEPAHLTHSHRLAESVRDACDHTTRPVVGGVGCGQCWERAIRGDALGVVHEDVVL